MRTCGNCGSNSDDNATYCKMCGALIGTNKSVIQNDTMCQNVNLNENLNVSNGQHIVNQQIAEQQRILNTMLEQQRMQQNYIQPIQPQYIYVSSEMPVKNPLAILAAIVCLISLFTDCLLGTNIIDICSACGKLAEFAEGGEKAALIMAMLLPWAIGGLTIVLLISAFTNSIRVLRDFLMAIYLASAICMFGVILDALPDIEASDFQVGFWFLIAGFVLALISHYSKYD